MEEKITTRDVDPTNFEWIEDGGGKITEAREVVDNLKERAAASKEIQERVDKGATRVDWIESREGEIIVTGDNLQGEKAEVVELGGELFVIDDTAKEEGSQEAVLTPLEEEDRESYLQHKKDGESDLEAVDQQVLVAPRNKVTSPEHKGYVKEGVIRLCKNDKCNKIVPPSKNVGRPKLFCEHRCAMRYSSRTYGKRERAKAGGKTYVEEGPDGKALQVQRVKPKSVAVAEARYKMHIQRPENLLQAIRDRPCPMGTEESSWKCPAQAFGDYYSKDRLCLVYAVFVDDWKEAMAMAEHRPYTRQWTTHDGYWYDKDAFAPHMDQKEGYVPVSVSPEKP